MQDFHLTGTGTKLGLDPAEALVQKKRDRNGWARLAYEQPVVPSPNDYGSGLYSVILSLISIDGSIGVAYPDP